MCDGRALLDSKEEARCEGRHRSRETEGSQAEFLQYDDGAEHDNNINNCISEISGHFKYL